MADQRSEGNWNSVEGSPRDHRPPEEDSSSNASSGRNGHIRDFNAGTNNEGPSTPPLLSSPSAVSSIGAFSNAISPLRRELTRSTLHDEPDNVSSSSSKLALAHRLSHLAQQLTSDDKVDELTLNNQVDEMERAMAQMSPRMANHSRSGSRFETRSHDGPGSSLLSSPSSSLFRPQFSDLSASLMPKGAEPESEKRQEQQKTTISRRQVDKIIAEATKLNDELTIVVANLKARQEESDHIQGLLIERAERAAQRIIFLQNRISYLEQELRHNDDELQHLHICLKAVEVQMPPHPDPDIQRCIATFKEDYQALKKKRASRSSFASSYDPESTQVDVTVSPR